MNQSTPSTAHDADQAPHAAARSVLMIRPAAFRRNEVTKPTNSFQSSIAVDDPQGKAEAAQREFDDCAATLRRHGVDVRIFPGRKSIQLPDEVFPNNWISAHPDGTIVLYPMMAWNRRDERRRDILDQLQQQADGFRIERIVDLSRLEESSCFLEGTGSLVLDHANRLAYACLSPRTTPQALRAFGREMDFGIIPFKARDHRGRAIYHTNVMMSLGEKFAVVCLESIGSVDDRLRLIMRLERSGRELIELRAEQLKYFCANLIQLRSGEERVIVMSKRARQALDDRQLKTLVRHGEIVTVDVGTIETYGGGSVRCMLAELYLPRKPAPDD